MDEYVAITQYVRLCKEQLEAQKEVLDKTKEGVVKRQDEVEDLIKDKPRILVMTKY